MLSAFLKAFTGRAGLLASVLALLIVLLMAAAAIMGNPRIEKTLNNASKAYLGAQLADGDKISGIEADGRDLHIKGDFQSSEAISKGVSNIDGVRRVFVENTSTNTAQLEAVQVVDEGDTKLAGSAAENADTNAKVQAAVTNETNIGATAQKVISDATESPLKVADAPVSDTTVSSGLTTAEGAEKTSKTATLAASQQDQSSLALRYDGAQLKLSGHMVDEQMAQLIEEEVRRVIPQGSTLDSSILADGQSSPLNWMTEFLDVAAGLPSDAQGTIEGSDKTGVNVLPDAEQTLKHILEQAETEVMPNSDSTSTGATSSASISVGSENTGSSGMQIQLGTKAEMDSEANTETLVADAEGAVLGGTLGEDTVEEFKEPRTLAEEEKDDGSAKAATKFADAQNPAEFIIKLNEKVAQQAVFASGDYAISDDFASTLDQLVGMMHQYPSLLLRVVGNIDFSVNPRDAEYVGVDRARAVRDYVRTQGVEPYRVFAAPLPYDYAFDKHVQIVFYISE